MITIGRAKRIDPSEDALAVLEGCHGKIRHFTQVVVELGKSQARVAELAHAAGLARRYFVEALPLHEADEELSLFPRIHAHDALLEALERDHREADLLVERICGLLQRLIDHDTTVQGELGYVGAQLEATWSQHLAREESELFPLARAELLPSARAVVLEEMRARRGFSHGN